MATPLFLQGTVTVGMSVVAVQGVMIMSNTKSPIPIDKQAFTVLISYLCRAVFSAMYHSGGSILREQVLISSLVTLGFTYLNPPYKNRGTQFLLCGISQAISALFLILIAEVFGERAKDFV